MPKAVIFDLDGTLLDTLADITAAMNHALMARGYPAATVDEVRTRVGWGLSTLVKSSLPEDNRHDGELVEAVARSAQAYYHEHPVVETVPYPGIVDLLRDLASGGYRLAVLSNKPDDLVQPIVEVMLEPVVRSASADGSGFAAVLGRREAAPHKPDPTTTYQVLAHMGVTAQETAFVGDSEIDIETAIAAGCTAVGVGWGFRAPEALSGAGAQCISYSIEDLRQVLGLEAKEKMV